MPRTKPYTEKGIRRLKCFRCGKQAHASWQICSDNRIYRPACKECDIEINKIILQFMGFPNWEEMLEKYKRKIGD